jgi:tetratricopeptide (TPR) repeat protein
MSKRTDKNARLTLIAIPETPAAGKAPVDHTAAWRTWGPTAVLLVAAILVAYSPLAKAGFVFDDDPLVLTNPCITVPDGLYRIWLTNENYEYLPLTYSVFWLEHQMWGTNPLGYHVVSVALHTANALLLWLLLRRLRVGGAWWGALLFAVHPVGASSVSWISEQKNLWGLLFALVSALLYLRFGLDGRRGWYALSIAAFVAALLGKTSVVMLPCLMLAFEWHRAGALRFKNALRVAPFFLASLVLGLVTIWFQIHRGMAGSSIPTATYAERLKTAGLVGWFYLGKAVAPIELSLIYPRWDYARMQWWPVVSLVAFLTVLWLTRRRWTWGRACWLAVSCFLVILVPVLGFVPMAFWRLSFVADHFQYPALPALTALAGALAAWAIRRLPAAAGAVGGIVAALVFLTSQQAAIYQSEETLCRANIRQNPDAWLAYGNLGKVLADRGDTSEALEFFAAGIRLKPDDRNLRGVYGDALLKHGDLSGAAAQYREAIHLQADDYQAHNNLAHVLLKQGKAVAALEHAKTAVALRPDLAEPHYNLAWSLNELGQPAAAAEEAQTAVTIDPRLTEAHFQLAVARLSLADGVGADAEFRQTLRLDPKHPLAHNNLASSLNRQGRPAEAAEHARAALAVEPNLPKARFNLGNAYFLQSMFREAEQEFREAIRLDPNFTEAKENLRAVLNRR